MLVWTHINISCMSYCLQKKVSKHWKKVWVRRNENRNTEIWWKKCQQKCHMFFCVHINFTNCGWSPIYVFKLHFMFQSILWTGHKIFVQSTYEVETLKITYYKNSDQLKLSKQLKLQKNWCLWHNYPCKHV
jgi:hypothetical protein